MSPESLGWRAALLLLGLLWFCAGDSLALARATRPLTRIAYSMGTLFRVQIYHPDPERAADAAEAALAVIRAQDQLLSDWIPESALNQAVARAWPGPVTITEPLADALEQALEFSRLTQGRFDISVGPLLRLWGFRGADRPRVPEAAALTRTLQAVGFDKVRVLRSPPRLQLLAAGMQLDFGGLGKGRALDLAARELRRLGIAAAALSCDSSSYFLGAPPGSPRGWPVLARHPRNPEQGVVPLWLKNQGLSSSGDDQQYFEQDGVRYSHILDPLSGWPARYHGSLTVVASSAATADALSTALLILPPDQAERLAHSQGLVMVRIWASEGRWFWQDFQPFEGWGSRHALRSPEGAE